MNFGLKGVTTVVVAVLILLLVFSIVLTPIILVVTAYTSLSILEVCAIISCAGLMSLVAGVITK